MRVPGHKFFVPANKKPIAGMARSYKRKLTRRVVGGSIDKTTCLAQTET